MAEKGAYLTGTNYAKPSVFEIVAQQSLASTLKPALNKIVSFLVSCNPERYGWLLRRSDEIYLLFDTVLQNYYLKNYSASFSETFYGLKRITVINSTVVGRILQNRQRTLSLLLLVLFPYLRDKISALSNKYKLDEADGRTPKENWQKVLKKSLIRGYTIYRITSEFATLYQYLLYVSGRSPYPTPMLRIASVTLTYADPQRILSIGDLLEKIRAAKFGPTDGILLLQMLITRSLELAAFFLQFFQWWSQENHTNFVSLPVPPPPPIPEIAKRYAGLCPICHKTRHIHTVLSVSGYVFCYECILRVVQQYGKCPITNYPAKEDNLIRLYVE